MQSKLYIPKKIKIGFQKRTDTFLGTLGYLIYTDDKGVLRKEKSWQSWRDKKIDPQDFDNEPTSGFVINKNITRGGWDHFSDKVVRVRVYDPRGFEFEITCDNLIAILMHTDCLRRGFEGEFVYGWAGTELVLLPVTTPEYTSSQAYTKLQGQKFSAKDLKPGRVYKSKRDGNFIYMGRHSWWKEVNEPYNYYNRNPSQEDLDKWRLAEYKYHIFVNEKGKEFELKDGAGHIAEEISEEIHEKYPELAVKLSEQKETNKFVSFKIKDISSEIKTLSELGNYDYSGPQLVKDEGKGIYHIYSLRYQKDHSYNRDAQKWEYVLLKYIVTSQKRFDSKTGNFLKGNTSPNPNNYSYSHYSISKTFLSKEEILEEFKELYGITADGREIKF